MRASLFRNFGAGVRLTPAFGCLSTKYQFLSSPIDVAATAAGYGDVFGAIDYAGAYGGLLASSEGPGRVPFSTQVLLHYDYADVGSYFGGSYKTGLWATSLGAGVPVRVNIGRTGALRIHPAASVNLPLSWHYWDWSYDPRREPPSPPTQKEQWRGIVTLDLGVGVSYITAR